MAKGIITIDVEDPKEVSLCKQWMERWAEEIEYKSHDYGCGCCVSSWYVHAPREAIKELIDEKIAVWDKPEIFGWIKVPYRRWLVRRYLAKQLNAKK